MTTQTSKSDDILAFRKPRRPKAMTVLRMASCFCKICLIEELMRGAVRKVEETVREGCKWDVVGRVSSPWGYRYLQASFDSSSNGPGRLPSRVLRAPTQHPQFFCQEFGLDGCLVWLECRSGLPVQLASRQHQAITWPFHETPAQS